MVNSALDSLGFSWISFVRIGTFQWVNRRISRERISSRISTLIICVISADGAPGGCRSRLSIEECPACETARKISSQRRPAGFRVFEASCPRPGAVIPSIHSVKPLLCAAPPAPRREAPIAPEEQNANTYSVGGEGIVLAHQINSFNIIHLCNILRRRRSLEVSDLFPSFGDAAWTAN